MRSLFGPVYSRRLGLSLGVNLFKENICSYDCVYCECGRTKVLTTKRDEYFELNDVLFEIKQYLSENCLKIDHITFSGRGEPTLYLYIEKLLEEIKRFPVASALLTNSSLLNNKEVRKSILGFDVIMPTISTVDQNQFNTIHRPAKGIRLFDILEGVKVFSKMYRGLFIPEIMIIKDVNDSEKSLAGLIEYIKELDYKGCHLNTIVRPAAYSDYKGINKEEINRIKNFLEKNDIRCIDADSAISKAKIGYSDERLINTLLVRPVHESDIKSIFKDPQIAVVGINKLLDNHSINKEKGFFKIS